MKKNGIAVDVVGLGDLSSEQKEKLAALVEAVSQEDNSTVRMIEPSAGCLSDELIGSEIFGGNRGVPMVNEEQDPELQMALRMSLEEVNNVSQAGQQNQSNSHNQDDDFDNEELERKALELSLEDNPKSPKKGDKDKKPDPDGGMDQE